MESQQASLTKQWCSKCTLALRCLMILTFNKWINLSKPKNWHTEKQKCHFKKSWWSKDLWLCAGTLLILIIHNQLGFITRRQARRREILTIMMSTGWSFQIYHFWIIPSKSYWISILELLIMTDNLDLQQNNYITSKTSSKLLWIPKTSGEVLKI